MTAGYRQHHLFLDRQKLEDILKSVGVKIVSETENELICYCPFHHNVDSPAMNFSKHGPAYLWKCWNGKCNQRGNIYSLLHKKGYSPAEIKRILLKGDVDPDNFLEQIAQMLKEPEAEKNIWEGVEVGQFREQDEEAGWRARDYLCDRGISREAYDYFRIGYSPKTDMLVIPAFNEYGTLMGVIGRSIEGKRYKYSAGLTRGKIIWNANNCLGGREIILTEGALDAVYIWQAGSQNVGAVLGSAISGEQWKVLKKNFTNLTCFFDNDEPGQNLTNSIIHNCTTMGVSLVEYPDQEGRAVKDPGDLSEEEIAHMVANRLTNIEYLMAMG